jgi:hypothetical protein
MKILYLFILTAFISGPSYADLASTDYVNESVVNRVDMTAGSSNTMAGTYTVTGTFDVPTQPLPDVTE